MKGSSLLERQARAKQQARAELAERIAVNYPYTAAEIYSFLDDLNETETRQLCTLACSHMLTPLVMYGVLKDLVGGDIHGALALARHKG